MRYEGKTEDGRGRSGGAGARRPGGGAEIPGRARREVLLGRTRRRDRARGAARRVESRRSQPTSERADLADDDRESRAAERRPKARSQREPSARAQRREGAMDDEAFAAVEATLTELLSAAGFFVEIRRRRRRTEMLFELIGDDVEPLLASRRRGLERPGSPDRTHRLQAAGPARLSAPGRRRLPGAPAASRSEELALRSAGGGQAHAPAAAPAAALPRRAAPDPPRAGRRPGESRRISEGEGFLKRVAVRPKAS